MTKTLEVTSSNGGSIKVGTTGTISTLMTQELESAKNKPQAPSSQRKTQSSPVSLPCSFICRKSSQKKKASSEPGSSSSNSRSNVDRRNPGGTDKTKHKTRMNGDVPMLGSDDVSVDRNPIRDNKVDKQGHSSIVEVVDVKCSGLKKLGFSKLSESRH